MAGQGPKVVLTFAGDSGPLDRTAKKVNATMGRLGKSLGGLASAGGAVNLVGGLAGALTQLAPAALLLPGALLAGAGAMTTFKVATAGFGDAVSAADPAAFAEATKDMAPSAVAAATAIRSLNPQVDALKKSVQGKFFEGWSGMLKETGDQLLPTVTTGMTNVAAGFNTIGRSALEAAQAPFFKDDIADILDNTGLSLTNMEPVLGSLLQGFVGLGGVGSSYLPALGDAITSVTDKFNAWVQAGVESGRINDLIDGAILGFQQLAGIVGNVGSIIVSVFSGLGGSTQSFLGPLEQTTAKLAEFFASAGAQEALGALGAAFQAAGALISSVFISALNTLIPIIIGLAPIVTAVATTMQSWAPVLGPIALGVIALGLALKGIVAGVALYNTIMKTVQAVTTAATGVQWLWNAALSANPIALVVIAIAALVAGLIWFFTQTELGQAIVTSAWEGIQAGIGSAVDWIKGAIAWFGELPGMFSDWFGQAKDAAVGKALELVGWVAGLPGRFLSALGNIGSFLLGAGRALIDGFRNGLSAAWNGLVNWFKGQLAWFRGLWPFSPAKWGPFSGTGYVDHSGKALVTDFASALEAGLPAVGKAAAAVMGAAQDPFAGLGSSVNLGDVDKATWDSLRSAGWKGRAGDNAERLYRPSGAAAAGGGGREVRFTGNVDSAFATAFMKLVRTGQIQIT